MRFLAVLLLSGCVAFGQAFTVRDIPFMAQGGVTDWAQRVINNGGAIPSVGTISCMETLRTTLIAQGITNKIYSLCVFVPDSVIASATPLFLHKGYPMWTNNFASGDLNIYGLKGNGTSLAMDTGVKGKAGQAANVTTGTRGVSVLITEASTNLAGAVIGIRDGAGEPLIVLQPSFSGRTEWYPGAIIGGNNALTNDFDRVGYVSGNVNTNTGTTNIMIFVASPLESHKVITNKVTTGAGGIFPATTTENTISVFAYKYDGTNNAWTTDRMSMAMVHDGLTQTESSNVWVAIQTCRQCLGGGDGDPIHDFNRKVVAGGGAAISTTTSNALRTFRQGMDTDALLYQIVVANCFVPDNLTAARTPLLWQAGHQIWTNAAFGATNLSVNGLAGNGTTKYLGLGINPVNVTYGGFGSANVGITALIFNIVASGAGATIGGSGTAASSFFTLYNGGGNLTFHCWKVTTVNTDFVLRAAPSPGATWPGYISGNRTAANAIRLDWVTNGVHNIATNGTGNQTGSTATITNLYAFASSAPGLTPGNFSDNTISFVSLHPGLTQTQSSNLWWRVANLRTNLGGGIPP